MSCKKNALPGMLESNRATAEGKDPFQAFYQSGMAKLFFPNARCFFAFLLYNISFYE
jgi:hypothetical protein